MFTLSESDIRRFWSKVEKRGDNECWPWIAKSKHWSGYGLLTLATGKPGGRKVVASRIACFLAHGTPPEGKPFALHSCDNPPCCNPKHLRWGTQLDNMGDCMERGRKTPPPKSVPGMKYTQYGEKKVNTKLTDSLVREIWRLHLSGMSATEISEQTGAGKHPVIDLCRGRSWRHLPDAPSIETLKAGGAPRGHNQFSRGGDTRALSPKTKIPTSEIPNILERIRNGETYESIGKTYGVLKSAIWSIKKTHHG